jgi:hypothetical protein
MRRLGVHVLSVLLFAAALTGDGFVWYGSETVDLTGFWERWRVDV